MAVQLSPGINVSEVDLTTIVPAVSTSVGAIAGLFRWGPVGELTLVDSENSLVNRFGTPTNHNAETFFAAANFLSYSEALQVSRAANTSGAVAQGTANSPGANVATPNSTFILTSGNVTSLGITNGMFVTQTTNSSVMVTGALVNGIVNSTAFTLNTTTTSNTNVTLYFGWPATVYSAVGLESGSYSSNLVNQIVKNESHYATKDGQFDNGVAWVARYPGAMGNSLRVSVVDTANQYTSNVDIAQGNGSVTPTITITTGSNTGTVVIVGDTSGTIAGNVVTKLTVGDNMLVGNSAINQQYIKIAAVGSVVTNATASTFDITFATPYRLSATWTSNTIQRYWEFFNAVGVAPGQSSWQAARGNTSAQDELHVVVVDEDGLFTGTPGTILETFKGLSRATDAQNLDGSANYVKTVINDSSRYIWWAAARTNAPVNTAISLTSSSATAPGNYNLVLGTDGLTEANVELSTLANAWDFFNSVENVDISIAIQGKPRGGTTTVNGQTVTEFQLANYLIDNLIAIRKDCVVAISPEKSMALNNFGSEAASLKNWRGAIHDSSYAILDTGYAYQYDRYNDLYRWIPLCGDIAGLMARTDHTNDAWWSPAGFNRGQIKNKIKLPWNPSKAERDVLYANGINPIVSFRGQGIVLYGDKTLQSKPSAFDHINVRRLFIVLEKAISEAAKYSLFEFNDSFTRAQFKNLVTPYLRTIQGRRGITDFLVVCDETNNTPDVIDANQFVGDIYIKPARSINYIQLNFVAVGTGVQFSQVVGQF